MPDKFPASAAEKHMIKLSIYLWRKCGRAKQEGWIRLLTPRSKKDLPFDHLDEIPAMIRQHLKMVGLTYDVAENSDDTVIATKSRRRKVIRKVRLGDR